MKCPACGFLNIAGSDECDSCQAPLIHADAPKKGMERRIIEGTVSDLAPKPAVGVSPGDSLKSAIARMRAGKIGCALVLEKNSLVGLVSEREILLRTADSTDFNVTEVSTIMRRNPIYLRESDFLADAFHRMAVSGQRHVPVRLNNGSYGVISARDLLGYLCRG